MPVAGTNILKKKKSASTFRPPYREGKMMNAHQSRAAAKGQTSPFYSHQKKPFSFHQRKRPRSMRKQTGSVSFINRATPEQSSFFPENELFNSRQVSWLRFILLAPSSRSLRSMTYWRFRRPHSNRVLSRICTVFPFHRLVCGHTDDTLNLSIYIISEHFQAVNP